MGIDRISSWMTMFGFGDYTGIDLYEESSANMPTRDWKMLRHRTPWYQGDTIPVGIGQGYWTATPMQIAKATSVLVNRGDVIAPHLLRATIDNSDAFENAQLASFDTYPPITGVKDRFWDIAVEGCVWLIMVLEVQQEGRLEILLIPAQVNLEQLRFLG